jgi:hypothetical protein
MKRASELSLSTERSGHHIQLDKPELVIKSVRANLRSDKKLLSLKGRGQGEGSN